MTTPIDGNDPAFPRATTMHPVTGQPWNDEQPGVPIRALLAGMQMQGLVSDIKAVELVCMGLKDATEAETSFAKQAVRLADSLIAELNKTTESVDGPSAGQCDEILGRPHYNAK